MKWSMLIQSFSSGVRAPLVFFGFLVAKQRIRTDKNLVCELLLPWDTYVQSFRSIAAAVTKRAVFTDNGRRTTAVRRRTMDDGQWTTDNVLSHKNHNKTSDEIKNTRHAYWSRWDQIIVTKTYFAQLYWRIIRWRDIAVAYAISHCKNNHLKPMKPSSSAECPIYRIIGRKPRTLLSTAERGNQLSWRWAITSSENGNLIG
jgi:hypothetical protein